MSKVCRRLLVLVKLSNTPQHSNNPYQRRRPTRIEEKSNETSAILLEVSAEDTKKTNGDTTTPGVGGKTGFISRASVKNVTCKVGADKRATVALCGLDFTVIEPTKVNGTEATVTNPSDKEKSHLPFEAENATHTVGSKPGIPGNERKIRVTNLIPLVPAVDKPKKLNTAAPLLGNTHFTAFSLSGGRIESDCFTFMGEHVTSMPVCERVPEHVVNIHGINAPTH